MASMIDEHPAFFDDDGKPLVDGEIFIGVFNADPEVATAIFSDPELTVALANPQTIDSFGRATNKIYIPGLYSMEVKDSNEVTKYTNLKNGEVQGTGITSIGSIAGTNNITGTATTTITAYVNNETYVFVAASANTGNVTLNWDGVGAKSLVYDFDTQLEQNHIVADQTIAATYNSTEDNFQWVNPNRQVRYGVEGASVASATTVDLGLVTGNSIDISGTTTITSFGTTPDGSVFWATATGIFQITYNVTSMIIPAQANYTTAVGDVIRIQSLGGGNNSIQIFRVDGKAVTPTDAPTLARFIQITTSHVANVTGNQTVTGAGFTPTSAIIFQATSGRVSYGMSDATTDTCAYIGGATNWDGAQCIFHNGSGNDSLATLSSFNSDGCVLAWTNNGAPGATVLNFTLQFQRDGIDA